MRSHPRPALLSKLAPIAALVALALVGCEDHPEDRLLGCWSEADWRYERVDAHESATMGRWTDGIRSREHPDRRILRHEAERWEFHPNRELVIVGRDGTERRARWRLKGRGHVMTLRFGDTGDFEVYNVQELASDRLVLHYDVGMELRGIARLEFRRGRDSAGAQACSSVPTPARRTHGRS
ncbi:MAG: hypothetical protein KF729_01415 [Sandaracinaceae bacterium]|nr:hypothetical protein [Sandaracinaceae bacterium]